MRDGFRTGSETANSIRSTRTIPVSLRFAFIDRHVTINLGERKTLVKSAGPMHVDDLDTCGPESRNDSRVARRKITSGGRDIENLTTTVSVSNHDPRPHTIAI